MLNEKNSLMQDYDLVSRAAHVIERSGLAMAGAMCGTFVAAQLAKAGIAPFDSVGFTAAMVLVGMIGFYLGIDIPRLPVRVARHRPRVEPVELLSAAGTFLAAQRNDIVIAEAEKFRNVIPHDHATERRGQRGDEQAMITPRDCARDRARSVTAETVRDEPLAREQDFARHFRAVPRHRANDRPDDVRLFIHGATPSESNRRFFGCRRGADSDTNRSAIADSAGNVQLSWVGSLTSPGPP